MDNTFIIPVIVSSALFLTLSILAARIKKRCRITPIPQTPDGLYTVSIWFWVVVIGFGIIGFSVGYGAKSKEGEMLWDVIILSYFIVFLILAPAVFCGIRCYVRIREGRVYYHNGIKCIEFSIEDIIHSEMTSLFLIEVVHVNDPHKPIIIPPMFNDLPRLVAILKKD